MVRPDATGSIAGLRGFCVSPATAAPGSVHFQGHGLGAVAGLLIRLAAPFLFDVRFPAPGMSPGRSADEVGDRAYLDLACVLTQ